jgi:hypothetical protein
MSAHAIRVDELQRGRFARDHLVGRSAGERQAMAIFCPTRGLVRDAQVAIDVVVETVRADQQLVHSREIRARLRALNDAMVVRRRHRHHFRDAEVGEDARIGGGVFGGVVDRAGGDDRALRHHQTRDGCDGAERSGIRQRERRTFKVGDFELIVARLAHDVVVALEELREVHRVRAFDVRDEQRARTVFFLEIDGDAEVHVGAIEARGSSVLDGERRVHTRELFDGLHKRERDDVRVRRLRLADQRQVIVDDAAVLFEHLDRDVADGRRGRDRERRLHVRDDLRRGAAQRDRCAG